MNLKKFKQTIYKHPNIFIISIALILFTLSQFEFSNDQKRDSHGRSRLYLAAENSNVGELKSLLKNIKTPDQRDECQWTPLMRSAQNKHLEASKLLIEAGADVNARDKGGYSVLMVASGSNNADILTLLTQKGARLNEQEDSLGWTALIWAAKEGHYENVSALLDAGADINLKDSTGKTAYDWSIENGHNAIAEKLKSQLDLIKSTQPKKIQDNNNQL